MTKFGDPDFDPFEEPDPLSNEANNAYGDVGYYTGNQAHNLLDVLSQPLLESQRDERGWYWPEGNALSSLVEFELILPHIRATGDVLTDEMDCFATGVTAFHVALPLTEAERNWLLRVSDDTGPHSHSFEVNIGEADDEIISNGLRLRLDGRDLLRRWQAWRRETDEYADQGTLDLAREALRGVVQFLLPNEPLPESYRTLRGLDEPSPEADNGL
jgi:hypothetical protein